MMTCLKSYQIFILPLVMIGSFAIEAKNPAGQKMGGQSKDGFSALSKTPLQKDSLDLPCIQFPGITYECGSDQDHPSSFCPKVLKDAEQFELRKPEDFPRPEADYQIIHYRWTYVPAHEEGNLKTGTVEESPEFPDALKGYLVEAGVGDRFIFDKFKLKGPEGKKRKHHIGINFKVKENCR